MAIIYSYPLNDDIKPLDELVGTTEKNINGQLKTVTRNFLLSDIAEFLIIDGGIQKTLTLTTNGTSGVSTLDQVTGILNIPHYPGELKVASLFKETFDYTDSNSFTLINTVNNVLQVIVNTTSLHPVAYSVELPNIVTVLNELYSGDTITIIYNYLEEVVETPNLQSVTDEGDSTTNQIEAQGFIKTGGLSTEFLMADGSTSNVMPFIPSDYDLDEFTNIGIDPFAHISDIPEAPALVFLDEGNGNGIARSDRNPVFFGNIGLDAFDISWSDRIDDGATGEGSFAIGVNVKARNYGSTVFGYLIDNNGIGSFGTGFNIKDVGYTNFATGIGHDVTSMNTTVVGQASNIIVSGTNDFNSYPTKPLFVVGNGTIQNADPDFNVLTRSDALIVRMNGLATLPSVTNALITADATNKAVITKEYLTSYTTTQLAGKMNNPSLTASYIPKALTATTIGNSRLLDTGTYLGIETVNTPSKDITLGRQTDRFIGIEQSDSNLVGRNLNISSGRTINYSESATFISTGQSSFGIEAMALAADGKIVALGHEGEYYEKPVGTNVFTYITYLSNSFYLSGASMAFNLIGDLYIIVGGNLKKRVGNTGSTFVNTTMNGSRLAIDGNDIYVTVDGVDVFKQTNSIGPFVALGTTPQTSYLAIVVNPTTKDIYVSNSNNISKITGGTGPNTLHRAGYVGSMYLSKNNDFYINALGIVYRQSNFSGAYTNVGNSNNAYNGAFSENNLGDIFLSGSSDGFMRYLQLYAVGSPNLQGGTLSLNAGTGKGTGASDIEMYTGQVLASGTDMQTSTLRAKINNTGLMTLPSVTNALIEADTTGKAVVTKEYVNNRLVVETTSGYTLTNADSGGIVIFKTTAAQTLTIPTGLADGFECTFVTLSGVTLTVSAAGVTLNNNTSTTLLPQLSFTLKRMIAADTYIATGNL